MAVSRRPDFRTVAVYEIPGSARGMTCERAIAHIPGMAGIEALRPEPTPEELQVNDQRLDPYGPIRKALRVFMSDTLGAIGRMDADDAAERAMLFGKLKLNAPVDVLRRLTTPRRQRPGVSLPPPRAAAARRLRSGSGRARS